MKAIWAGGITLAAWILAGIFIVTLSGGLALLNVSRPNWQEYRSQAGRYSVLMPGKPKEQTQSVNSAVGTLDMHIASYEDRSGAYLIMYTDYPADLVNLDRADAMLDGGARGAVENVNGNLIQQQDFPLGNIPGREIEFNAPAQGAQPATRVKVRYFLVNNRMYQVMVVAQQSQGLPVDTQKYLDSFKLIDN